MKYDVIVIGAGPAGSTAAKFLAEKKARVLLIDKSKFPRDKPCGGLILIRTLKRFPYIKDLIGSYCYGGRIYSSSLKNQVKTQKSSPIAAFVVRKDYDHDLVRLAEKSGATLIDGSPATDVQISNDKATVTLNNREVYESSLVIGADGVWSVVAKKTGLGNHYPYIGRCLLQEVPISDQVHDKYFTKENHFKIFLKFKGIDGFGWIAPKNGLVNIGIGDMLISSSQKKRDYVLKDIYVDFIHALKEQDIIPSTITSETLQGGTLPLIPFEKTYTDRAILCGDAAGQMNPLTGDGIHYAMSAGMFAADACAKALAENNFNASNLSKYEMLWKNDFGDEIKLLARVLKMVLKGNRDEKYIRMLSKDPKIFDLIFKMAENQEKMQDYKWKMARALVTIYIKDTLGLTKLS